MNIRKESYARAAIASVAAWASLFCVSNVSGAQEASVWLEIVTEQGVQATAHREWLQLLTSAGVKNVRIRGYRPGDEPHLTRSGSDEWPRYSLVGMLDSRGNLTLPGGRFDRRSANKLKDYFDRLRADGTEGVTAERGRFGLTEKEFRLAHADLSQPINFSTKGKPLADVLKSAEVTMNLQLQVDDAAWEVIRRAEPVADEVEALTLGTGLAILLRREGLVLLPHKERGKEVAQRVARRSAVNSETWPVGWESDARTSQLAPEMMKSLNAEVAGFTLAEAMDAIGPRMGVPIYWDHATLGEQRIDPAETNVQLARQRTQLVRVIDRLLFQARLRGELRVDEAGTVFYWISR